MIPEQRLEQKLAQRLLEQAVTNSRFEQAAQLREQGLPEPKRLLRQIESRGAVSALKEQLRRRQLSEHFDVLAERGLLRCAPEALVTSSEFGALFSDEEADFCLQALLDAGFYG